MLKFRFGSNSKKDENNLGHFIISKEEGTIFFYHPVICEITKKEELLFLNDKDEFFCPNRISDKGYLSLKKAIQFCSNSKNKKLDHFFEHPIVQKYLSEENVWFIGCSDDLKDFEEIKIPKKPNTTKDDIVFAPPEIKNRPRRKNNPTTYNTDSQKKYKTIANILQFRYHFSNKDDKFIDIIINDHMDLIKYLEEYAKMKKIDLSCLISLIFSHQVTMVQNTYSNKTKKYSLLDNFVRCKNSFFPNENKTFPNFKEKIYYYLQHTGTSKKDYKLLLKILPIEVLDFFPTYYAIEQFGQTLHSNTSTFFNFVPINYSRPNVDQENMDITNDENMEEITQNNNTQSEISNTQNNSQSETSNTQNNNTQSEISNTQNNNTQSETPNTQNNSQSEISNTQNNNTQSTTPNTQNMEDIDYKNFKASTTRKKYAMKNEQHNPFSLKDYVKIELKTGKENIKHKIYSSKTQVGCKVGDLYNALMFGLVGFYFGKFFKFNMKF
jgi:hypothetical protein